MRERWAATGAVLLLTLLALAGSSRLDGPVLLRLSEGHGVHVTDLLAVAAAGAVVRSLHRRPPAGVTGRAARSGARSRP